MNLSEKINIIRASVMGANDGIISVAGIVLGVFAATEGRTNGNWAIFIAGFAGTLAGMISMAAGEYVSVHGQRDAENAAIQLESEANRNNMKQQIAAVQASLISDDISLALAKKAASEMMMSRPIDTAVRVKHGFNIQNKINPYHAAIASFVTFPLGALLPMSAILASPKNLKIISTYAAVMIALILTGYFAAKIGNADTRNGIVRNVIAGLFTMTATFLIGRLFNR
ncbi:VIT family protein [Oenococcus sicerae]|uniref:VIT family protein n=1 Tax=Oenococcus sicerae TaxID=2203724 RepID=A0AAJ1R8J3_9LACO|nr:VIT family protein [Oenococcus sicerae]MDN6899988.1 VIT family protein [Oenococcus sicerae]QAS69603.1 VIT family protein [Oenococcus sicerae]